ncbi:hypothetical protein ACIBCT_22715 [Streptosporangium sp. NPDC050855]|uniref:hypothetical protein n=1 Tax=Streptosporangium sp. NPDC050855 TaxID=3366194 RepID=UPI0037B23A55
MTGRPFTVLVCQAGPCRSGEPGLDVLTRLAATVRHSPHGVLVRTGCLLNAPRCRTGAAHDSGCHLVVQPCDVNRRPRGTAIPVGPILTPQDARAVTSWLAGSVLDAEGLAPRLRTIP